MKLADMNKKKGHVPAEMVIQEKYHVWIGYRGTGMKTTEECIRHALKTIRKLEGFENVRFIILYGSVAEGRPTETSDIDLCIYYAGTREEGGEFRFLALSELCNDQYDIQIFVNLPLYVQKEVLQGRVIYCPDERFLYDTAYQTIQEYDDFKHRLDDYLGIQAIR